MARAEAEATLRPPRFEDSFYKPLDRSGFKGPVPTATRAWFYAPRSPKTKKRQKTTWVAEVVGYRYP